ncbi:MAG: hypothetical protein ACOYKZ_06325 [Chlamydiia bacterium]
MDASDRCGFTPWIQTLVSFKPPSIDAAYSGRSLHERLELLGRDLLQQIETAPDGKFLLPAVMRWIAHVNEQGWATPLQYQISSFESWLERASGCSMADQRIVRGKIMGQLLPRSVYQALFPVGQDRVLPGSHIVTAHSSPDLDTTMASFWGWCDAFAAPTSRRLHHWNVPGGLPDLEEVQLLFQLLFGSQIFESPKARSALALTAFDLLAAQPLPVVKLDETLHQLDTGLPMAAVVDGQGHVVGELRPSDVEGVRQITNPIMSCLRWMERHIEQTLIDFYATPDPKAPELNNLLSGLRDLCIEQAEPFRYFSEVQQQQMAQVAALVLALPSGLKTPIREWPTALQGLNIPLQSGLLQQFGFELTRADAFKELAQVSHQLTGLNEALWQLLERVDTALKIKREILHRTDQWVGVGADVEEMRTKLQDHSALMVIVSDGIHGVLPEGLVMAQDLRNPILGTVTLRDFSNREEVSIPSYLELVSCIDHHKTSLTTQRPPTIYLADVQAANTLVAEQMLDMQGPYASGGWSVASIQEQLQRLERDSSPKSLRIRRRLLHRLDAAQLKGIWVAPERQWWEAVYLIFAILDDTDLLSKVSWRDVQVVADLLNLLESLDHGEEREELNFCDCSCDQPGCLEAAARLLRHTRLQQWIDTVYQAKEEGVNRHLELAARGMSSNCFRDLKIQNNCAAVSQLKLFAGNIPEYNTVAEALRKAWQQISKEMFKQRPEIDLYVHMISTITVTGDGEKAVMPPGHQDELWIWTPPPQASRVHLRVFLSNLYRGPLAGVAPLKIILLGPASTGLHRIVEEAMPGVPMEEVRADLASTMLILRYPPSLLNSRKGTISPNLPRQGNG